MSFLNSISTVAHSAKAPSILFGLGLFVGMLSGTPTAQANQCSCFGAICDHAKEKLCRDERQFNEFHKILELDQKDLRTEYQTGCGPRCRNAKSRIDDDNKRLKMTSEEICKDLRELPHKGVFVFWPHQSLWHQHNCR